jgi:hypothetical protein
MVLTRTAYRGTKCVRKTLNFTVHRSQEEFTISVDIDEPMRDAYISFVFAARLTASGSAGGKDVVGVLDGIRFVDSSNHFIRYDDHEASLTEHMFLNGVTVYYLGPIINNYMAGSEVAQFFEATHPPLQLTNLPRPPQHSSPLQPLPQPSPILSSPSVYDLETDEEDVFPDNVFSYDTE